MKKITIQLLVLSLFLTVCFLSFAHQPSEANTMGLVRKAYLPHYPQLPSGAREAGDVFVLLTVDSKGVVVDAKSSGASEALRREVETTVREWKFGSHSPRISVIFSFTLYEKGQTQCRPSIEFGNLIRVKVCEQRKKVVVISDPPLVDLSKPNKH